MDYNLSRYVLYKKKSDWTEPQQEQGKLLFELSPDIEKAYNLSQELSEIFEKATEKFYEFIRLALWHKKVRQSEFISFNKISRTIANHYQTIVNYFDHHSANASGESFNAKIKVFRSQFRGVRNKEYFLYRLTQIYV